MNEKIVPFLLSLYPLKFQMLHLITRINQFRNDSVLKDKCQEAGISKIYSQSLNPDIEKLVGGKC